MTYDGIVPLHKPDRLLPKHWSEFSIPRECAYCVKGLIEPEQHIEIYGASGSGKTFLALDVAYAIASGRAIWFGMKVRKTSVLYICAEGGAASFAKRSAAIQEKYGIKPGDCNLHVITVAPNFGIDNADDARTIRAHIERLAPGEPWAIFNDTVAKSMHGQSEDRAEGMGAYISNARSFTEARHAFVSIHHTGKDAERGSRGSYALPADVDGLLSVEKRGDVSVVLVRKARDGKDGAKFAFNLVQVPLGEDDEGDSITSCVVEETNEIPAKSTAATKLSPKEKDGLEALRECMHDQGTDAPDSNHYPAGARVVRADQWRETCRLRGVFSEKNPRTDWSRLRSALKDKKATAEWNDLIWIVKPV